MTDAATRTAVPWELRLSTLFGGPAWIAGVWFGAALIGFYLIVRWLEGGPVIESDTAAPLPVTANTHAIIGYALLLGFALGAARHTLVATQRDLRSVRGESEPPTRGADLQVDCGELRGSRWMGGIGGLVGLGVTGLLLRIELSDSDAFDPVSLLTLLLPPTVGWTLGRLLYFTLHFVKEIVPQASAATPLDLLDLKPFALFGRMGLRVALMWIVGISLWILIGVTDPNPELLQQAIPVVAGGVAFSIVVGLSGLVVPVRGVRRRIREAKRVELATLESRLREARDSVQAGGGATPGELGDLLAYRAYVEGLREWPFDATTLARTTLFILIPLASWVGGALVERLVGSLLD